MEEEKAHLLHLAAVRGGQGGELLLLCVRSGLSPTIDKLKKLQRKLHFREGWGPIKTCWRSHTPQALFNDLLDHDTARESRETFFVFFHFFARPLV